MIHWDLFEALKKWISSLKDQQNYSEKTIDAYWGDVHACLKFLSSQIDTPLTCALFQNLESTDFKRWLDFRKEKGYGVRSTVRAFSILKQFCRFLMAQEIITKDPVEKIKPPSVILKDPIHRKCFVLRNKIIHHLFNNEGLTITEILSLNKGDVLVSPPMISITNRKNKKRFLPITSDLLESTQMYLTFLPFPFLPNTPLFIGPRGKRLTASAAREIAISYMSENELQQGLM